MLDGIGVDIGARSVGEVEEGWIRPGFDEALAVEGWAR